MRCPPFSITDEKKYIDSNYWPGTGFYRITFL